MVMKTKTIESVYIHKISCNNASIDKLNFQVNSIYLAVVAAKLKKIAKWGQVFKII